MNERNLNVGQWEDRKQWSLGVKQHKKMFWNRYIYVYIYIKDLLYYYVSSEGLCCVTYMNISW
jgi:hypothetical protein